LKVVVDAVVETENGYNGFSRLAAVNLDQGLETKALDTTVKVIKKGSILLLHKQGTNLPNIGFELVYNMGFSIRGPINLKQKNYIHLPNNFVSK
jgi:hypothetical protein